MGESTYTNKCECLCGSNTLSLMKCVDVCGGMDEFIDEWMVGLSNSHLV